MQTDGEACVLATNLKIVAAAVLIARAVRGAADATTSGATAAHHALAWPAHAGGTAQATGGEATAAPSKRFVCHGPTQRTSFPVSVLSEQQNVTLEVMMG